MSDSVPFGSVAVEGDNGIHPYFRCFFKKPFESVDVFGRSDGNVNFIGPAVPIGLVGTDQHGTAFFAGILDDAFIHTPFSVYKNDFIADAMAKHLHAMPGFVFLHKSKMIVYVGNVKPVHEREDKKKKETGYFA